ncbi:MAG TPA: hypothetical protein VGI16_10055 [Candidatus Acidoferrum sp.]|jgi:hypothetical protein
MLKIGMVAVLFLLGIRAVVGQVPNIRKIDFKNFLYAWDGSEDTVPMTWRWLTTTPNLKFQVVNGTHHFYRRGESQAERERAPFISVDSIVYGDLDGDGVEEAAVTFNYSTGGTANWDYLYVYKMVEGQPVLMGRMEAGSRGSGGLATVSIKDERLMVEFADPERRIGDCCSEGYIRVHYRLTAKGFVEDGSRERGDLRSGRTS